MPEERVPVARPEEQEERAVRHRQAGEKVAMLWVAFQSEAWAVRQGVSSALPETDNLEVRAITVRMAITVLVETAEQSLIICGKGSMALREQLEITARAEEEVVAVVVMTEVCLKTIKQGLVVVAVAAVVAAHLQAQADAPEADPLHSSL